VKYQHCFAILVDDTMQKNTLIVILKKIINTSKLIRIYLLAKLLSVYIVQVSATVRLLQNVIG